MSPFINTVFNTNYLAMDDLVIKEFRKYIDAQMDFMKATGASTAVCQFEVDDYELEIKLRRIDV